MGWGAHDLAAAFLGGLFGAAVTAPFIYKWLLRVRSRQIVSEYVAEHQKKQGTPTMGGLIVLAGFLVALALELALGGATLFLPTNARALLQAIVLVLGFGLIGFADDFIVPRMLKGKRGLGWKQKFGLQVVFSVAAMSLAPTAMSPWAMAWGVFLIMFYSNAYNFADGMDGLAGGLLCILAPTLGFMVGGSEGTLSRMVLGFALVGAVVPFLVLNAPPAKVFMGDVGALPIGAVLGLMASQLLSTDPVNSSSKSWIAVIVASGVLIAELVPVPLQIASVKLRKKRLFPMTPIHHAFEKAGWDESRVVWCFLLTQFVLSILAMAVLG